jgi:uncharacterized membrane protein
VSAVIFGFLMKIAENNNISTFLQKNSPWLVINDLDTARNILTTLIGGGVSMLVFSFSMVMLLLSQAATNYSPRVLPSLISNKRHQIILGTFLATILYNIITIIGIEPRGEDYQLPGFSVLLGIISSIVALAAFVYFIHSISTSIQINNILRNIFLKSRDRLVVLVEENRFTNDFPDTSNWHVYKTPITGTVQNFSITGLKDLAEEIDTKFSILSTKGTYIFDNQDLVKSEKKLEKEEEREMYKNFNFSESELVIDNYVLGLKQIAEIGIKAMSPGINDPGTALDTINYLTELLALRMKKKDTSVVKNDDEQPVLSFKVISFDILLYNILAPYRTYCKHDMTVMQKLMYMIAYLKKQDAADDQYYAHLDREAGLLLKDGYQSIQNPVDREVLQGYYDGMGIEEA